MLPRVVVVVVPLLIAATAHAQAPGEVAPQAAPAPVVVPVVAAPCGGCIREPVMANRWAVGLSIGSMGITPKDSPDDKTEFAIGELSIRFRATPHLELELAVGGGTEKLADGMDGQRQVSTGTLGLRYRFMPEHHWNWYLLAGIGSTSVTQKDATDQERHDAERGHFQLGAGLEHRWNQFALGIELRGTAIAPPKDNAASTMPVAGTANTTTTTEPPPTMTGASSAGQLTIGASYYF